MEALPSSDVNDLLMNAHACWCHTSRTRVQGSKAKLAYINHPNDSKSNVWRTPNFHEHDTSKTTAKTRQGGNFCDLRETRNHHCNHWVIACGGPDMKSGPQHIYMGDALYERCTSRSTVSDFWRFPGHSRNRPIGSSFLYTG